MLKFFLLSLRRQVLGPEGHGLETFWEASVTRRDRDILKHVLEFFGERDTCETCTLGLAGLSNGFVI